MKKINIFCFPHAGGSSATFKKWESILLPDIELIPLELAGRGRRITDPPYQSIMEGVGDLFKIIKPRILSGPYVFFGHSMGALFAFELAKRIRKEKLPAPLHLFFSGQEAPHVELPERKMFHRYPEEEFREKLIELGGPSKELFDNPALLALMLPVLKNDLFITETYDRKQPIDPLAQDFTLFIGKEDDLSMEEVTGWKEHTRGICTIHYFPGDHFFIHDQTAKVVELLKLKLSLGVKRPAAPNMGFYGAGY